MAAFSFAVCLCLLSAAITRATTVTYDFNLTWVIANPDDVYERPTLGINGKWPLPPITADVGDRVVVNVNNQLENRTASLHFHGIYMNGTTHMDGPVGATQCRIPAGGSLTYDFNVSTILRGAGGQSNSSRSSSQAHTGTMPTMMASIQMDYVDR